MARRGLLNDADRNRLFGVPDDDASLIRFYSVSDDDRDFILSKRGTRNQLGMAVQLSLLRNPGFGLRLEDEVPAALIQFLAQQIGAPWPVFQDYARRGTTRREHFGEAAKHLGLLGHAQPPIVVICSPTPPTRQCRRRRVPRSSLRCSSTCVTTGSLCRLQRASNGLAWPARARSRRLTADAMIVGLGAAKAAF